MWPEELEWKLATHVDQPPEQTLGSAGAIKYLLRPCIAKEILRMVLCVHLPIKDPAIAQDAHSSKNAVRNIVRRICSRRAGPSPQIAKTSQRGSTIAGVQVALTAVRQGFARLCLLLHQARISHLSLVRTRCVLGRCWAKVPLFERGGTLDLAGNAHGFRA